MNDEERRIRGYLQAQGAKLSPAQIVEKVRVAMADLRGAAEAIPPARFADPPEPGEWSGDEVMAHVVQAGRHFGDAIVAALESGSARRPGRDDAPSGPHTAEQWFAIFERDREALFAIVLGADPTARLDATIDDGPFGSLNWRETLLFMRLHDIDHVGQLKKIAAVHQSAGGPS